MPEHSCTTKRLSWWGAAVLCALNAGCLNGGADPNLAQIQQLQDKVQSQARQISQKDAELSAAERHIQQLRDLKGDRSIDNLVHVAKIELERLSGTYDDNADGQPDGIVLYLCLYDKEGDLIKASGTVNLKLLDLSAPEASQKLAQLDFDAATLRGMWYGRFMTSHYTLRIPWAKMGGVPHHSPITVLLTFTDLLSGKAFDLQQTVQVPAAVAASK